MRLAQAKSTLRNGSLTSFPHIIRTMAPLLKVFWLLAAAATFAAPSPKSGKRSNSNNAITDDNIRANLPPEAQALFDKLNQKQRAEALSDVQAIGLKLPDAASIRFSKDGKVGEEASKRWTGLSPGLVFSSALADLA